MRQIVITIAAVVLATIGAAAAVFAAEPEEVETASAVTTCSGGRRQLNATEEGTLPLHNQVRENRNMSRLCVHPALTRAARSHSADMIRKDYFRHGNGAGRLRKVHYRWLTYGENIALG